MWLFLLVQIDNEGGADGKFYLNECFRPNGDALYMVYHPQKWVFISL